MVQRPRVALQVGSLKVLHQAGHEIRSRWRYPRIALATFGLRDRLLWHTQSCLLASKWLMRQPMAGSSGRIATPTTGPRYRLRALSINSSAPSRIARSSPSAQSKRFIETAREIGASEDAKDFDKAFSRVTARKPSEPTGQKR